jgi:hypothetical protein
VHSSTSQWAPFCLPLAALALLASPARGQSDAGPAPPAHLPRLIWECEAAVGATSNTCSAWIWHGASYSATWSIGAIGQMTVASGNRAASEGNPAELSVRRLDTTGSLAGLTATYTGKWTAYHPGTAVAAIYSDGTTFGDRKVLAAMIDYRRSMLASLTNIGATLCTLGTRGSSIADVETALNKQHTAEDARSPADKDARGAAYTTISKSMGGRATARLSPSQIIKQTLDRLNQLRSGLADPVKNSSGQPVISPVTAPTCSLR